MALFKQWLFNFTGSGNTRGNHFKTGLTLAMRLEIPKVHLRIFLPLDRAERAESIFDSLNIILRLSKLNNTSPFLPLPDIFRSINRGSSQLRFERHYVKFSILWLCSNLGWFHNISLNTISLLFPKNLRGKHCTKCLKRWHTDHNAFLLKRLQ